MEFKQQTNMSDNGETEEHRQLRKVAFFSIVISTAAVVASVITLPLLYSYVAGFQSHMVTEAEFCKTRSRYMWTEMTILNQNQPLQRGKRQYAGPTGAPQPPQPTGGYGPMVNPESSGQCCNCQQGPPGPPGPQGDDGESGKDGHGAASLSQTLKAICRWPGRQ
jgi:hypothetical protein